jgi:peptide/nickel transport system substrate-binding protein
VRPLRARLVVVLLAAGLLGGAAGAATAAPEGTMTWGVHITLASRWLDPAETEGIITPFMVLYALHDALVKPMPGSPTSSSSARA